MKDAWDLKARLERMEDRGITPDMAYFIADVQEDASKSILKQAKQNLQKELRKRGLLTRAVNHELCKVLNFNYVSPE